VAAALASSLRGGSPIAPLPTDPIDRAAAIAALQPWEPVTESDTVAVLATSGSTGARKGVVLSGEAIRASAEATHLWLGGLGDWVLALPSHYIAGFMVLARACLAATRAMPIRSDLNDLPEVVGALSPRRYISLVPPQLDRALRRHDVADALASFSAVLVGGGPISDDLVKRARLAGIHVVKTYGMTETCGGCVYDGQPLPGVDIELDDDDRIMIRSNSLFSGYRLRRDLTDELLKDGWFRTQDRGNQDGGQLAVLGRCDDVVVTGGHKVDLGEVDRCVQHWATDQDAHAAVLGVPDAVWGTVIIAVSDVPGSLDDLQALVCRSLPGYAMPRELIYLNPLPWLANGKLDRVAITSMVVEILAKRQAPV
jgi:O-succinylbenzoic acid--CoA ligase